MIYLGLFTPIIEFFKGLVDYIADAAMWLFYTVLYGLIYAFSMILTFIEYFLSFLWY